MIDVWPMEFEFTSSENQIQRTLYKKLQCGFSFQCLLVIADHVRMAECARMWAPVTCVTVNPLDLRASTVSLNVSESIML